MKCNEIEFKKLVAEKYHGEIKVVGKYLGLAKPLLIENKYGLMKTAHASLILQYEPSILIALNKTEYAMRMLRDKQPEIYSQIECLDEYKTMKTNILFKTVFGVVKTSFDMLLSGHMPTIRSAVDRKEYFRNQMKLIYGDLYDFKITTTSRHGGKSILVCPIHGEVIVDNDYLFMGVGCPKCKGTRPSTTFYLIKLTYKNFQCHKIGISYRKENGSLRRYDDYLKKHYGIEVIKERDFSDLLELKQYELKIKQLIKPYLITPPNWDNKTSTECFTEDLLDIVLEQIHMI